MPFPCLEPPSGMSDHGRAKEPNRTCETRAKTQISVLDQKSGLTGLLKKLLAHDPWKKLKNRCVSLQNPKPIRLVSKDDNNFPPRQHKRTLNAKPLRGERIHLMIVLPQDSHGALFGTRPSGTKLGSTKFTTAQLPYSSCLRRIRGESERRKAFGRERKGLLGWATQVPTIPPLGWHIKEVIREATCIQLKPAAQAQRKELAP